MEYSLISVYFTIHIFIIIKVWFIIIRVRYIRTFIAGGNTSKYYGRIYMHQYVRSNIYWDFHFAVIDYASRYFSHDARQPGFQAISSFYQLQPRRTISDALITIGLKTSGLINVMLKIAQHYLFSYSRRATYFHFSLIYHLMQRSIFDVISIDTSNQLQHRRHTYRKVIFSLPLPSPPFLGHSLHTS